MKQIEPRANKIPLAQAASILSDLCERIDDEGNLDEYLETFKRAEVDLRQSVDRRISVMQMLADFVRRAGENKDAWAKRKKQFEYALERIKEFTKEVMQENPDIPYAGEYGKLAVQKNPVSIKYDLEFGESKSFTPVKDASRVPTEFLKLVLVVDSPLLTDVKDATELVSKASVKFFILDKERLAIALKSGVKFDFAQETQGTHLRIKLS